MTNLEKGVASAGRVAHGWLKSTPHPNPLPGRGGEGGMQMDLADPARGEFLRRLDASDFHVTEFEARFIESYLKWESNFVWSPARRATCDKMMRSYKIPGHIKAPAQVRIIPPAVPGQCAYLVRGDAGQVRCGSPAINKTSIGLELCAEHDQARKQYAERLRQIKARR